MGTSVGTGTTERAPRWVWIALVVYGLFAVILLLSPIGPGEIVGWLTGLVQRTPGLGFVRQGWMEFGLNIVLFLPLGLLLTLLFRHPWIGVGLAVALSVAAELAQMLLPGRMSSLRDVLANSLGALLGALIASLIIRHRHRSAQRSKQRSTQRSAPPTETTRAR